MKFIGFSLLTCILYFFGNGLSHEASIGKYLYHNKAIEVPSWIRGIMPTKNSGALNGEAGKIKQKEQSNACVTITLSQLFRLFQLPPGCLMQWSFVSCA